MPTTNKALYQMGQSPTFYEFFCGGGMARAGLGKNWRCLFANDIDAVKGESYKKNWGARHLHIGDIGQVTTTHLPEQADLAWASFPCQDLSLAGNGAGLNGGRSGTFWLFMRLINSLRKEDRHPRMIVLENVCGAITSHDGADFAAICKALHDEDYAYGAIVADAADFLPQSRPRLFFVAVQKELVNDELATGKASAKQWHTEALVKAWNKLDPMLQADWLWWLPPKPPARKKQLKDIIETDNESLNWHTPGETNRLLGMMSDVNIAKLEKAASSGKLTVGSIYKRTRPDALGQKKQRAEVRFDGTAGCLRTPSGGSSRQILIFVEGKNVCSRLISARETARLMGLPDSYKLPEKYNDAYHLTGDGIVVPVVSYLRQHLFEPTLALIRRTEKAA